MSPPRRTTNCRSCGAELIWAVHERTGKFAPLELADDGPFVERNGDYRARRAGDKGPFYATHFATCPEADRHRRGS